MLQTINSYLLFYITLIKLFFKNFNEYFFKNTYFLEKYYVRNEYIWQDGFLFDFLQKKVVDLWVRQFVIYTGFLFSERYIFENLVYVYLKFLIWPAHFYSLFDTSNVSDILTTVFYTFILLFYIYIGLYFWIIF